ncbi:MAG: RNA 2',3'-cyclic phosphodiesterase [Thermacetogeniaceae bacterium]
MSNNASREKIRSFLAILLPGDIRKAIHQQFSSKLKKLPLDVKWVEEENYHLTLKFFGSLNAKEIQQINKILNRVIPQIEQFTLSYEGLGVFPDLANPRVIWLGLSGEVEKLKMLHSKIENELSAAGFPREEKKFQPHLTIGRFRSNSNLEMFIKYFNELREAPFSSQIRDIEVQELHLMKSVLTPAGPRYSSLAAYPLRKNSSENIRSS